MKRVQVTEESRNPTWKSKKKGIILIKNMDDDYLQKALLYSQSRIYHFQKKMDIFNEKVHQIDAEAERRGIKLKDIGDIEIPNKIKQKKLKEHWDNTRTLEDSTKLIIKT